MPRLTAGEQIPDWSGMTVDGQNLGREALHGRPVVLLLLRSLR